MAVRLTFHTLMGLRKALQPLPPHKCPGWPVIIVCLQVDTNTLFRKNTKTVQHTKTAKKTTTKQELLSLTKIVHVLRPRFLFFVQKLSKLIKPWQSHYINLLALDF